jgi:hypothetical protein
VVPRNRHSTIAENTGSNPFFLGKRRVSPLVVCELNYGNIIIYVR